MGCDYSKENCVYSLTCCFCKKPRNASYWIAIVGMVYGGFVMCFDWIQAHMHYEPCDYCLDYHLNLKLSYVSAIIDSVQWCSNILLIHGLRKNWKFLVLFWLIWIVVYLAMQLVWVCITLPYTPTLRGFSSMFHTIWAVHYFIVVKTQYTMMALTFDPPEEPLKLVPLNSPTRLKHKRQKKRAVMNNNPPIRTLLGACIKLREEQLKRRLFALQHPEQYEEKYGDVRPPIQPVVCQQVQSSGGGIENQGAQLNETTGDSSSSSSDDASQGGSSITLIQKEKEREMAGNEGNGQNKASGYIIMDIERENDHESTNPFDDNFCDEVPVREKPNSLDGKNGECTIAMDTSTNGNRSSDNLHRRRISYKIATNNEGFDKSSEFVFL